MSEIATRWPVRLVVTLESADRDDDDQLTNAAVERLFDIARAAYFAHCRTVDLTAIAFGPATTPSVRGPVHCDEVTVSVPTGVTDAIRDELIALAHSASHWH